MKKVTIILALFTTCHSLLSLDVKQRLSHFYTASEIENGSWVDLQGHSDGNPDLIFQYYSDEEKVAFYTEERVAYTSAREKISLLQDQTLTLLKEKVQTLQTSINFWQQVCGLGSDYFVTKLSSNKSFKYDPQALLTAMHQHYEPACQKVQKTGINQYKNFPQKIEYEAVYNTHVKMKTLYKEQFEYEQTLEKITQLEQDNLHWQRQGYATFITITAVAGGTLYAWNTINSQKKS